MTVMYCILNTQRHAVALNLPFVTRKASIVSGGTLYNALSLSGRGRCCGWPRRVNGNGQNCQSPNCGTMTTIWTPAGGLINICQYAAGVQQHVQNLTSITRLIRL
eukprot:3395583-Amphidinium_carterae.1